MLYETYNSMNKHDTLISRVWSKMMTDQWTIIIHNNIVSFDSCLDVLFHSFTGTTTFPTTSLPYRCPANQRYSKFQGGDGSFAITVGGRTPDQNATIDPGSGISLNSTSNRLSISRWDQPLGFSFIRIQFQMDPVEFGLRFISVDIKRGEVVAMTQVCWFFLI